MVAGPAAPTDDSVLRQIEQIEASNRLFIDTEFTATDEANQIECEDAEHCEWIRFSPSRECASIR